MKNSPLQLEHYCVNAVHLDANLDAKVAEKLEWRIDAKYDLATHRDDSLRWKVDLMISFHATEEAKSPYKGTLSFVGFFAVDASYPKDKVQFLVETNGPSVLFGAVREMVANITARGPWPMVLLPTQSFYQSRANQLTATSTKPVKQAPVKKS